PAPGSSPNPARTWTTSWTTWRAPTGWTVRAGGSCRRARLPSRGCPGAGTPRRAPRTSPSGGRRLGRARRTNGWRGAWPTSPPRPEDVAVRREAARLRAENERLARRVAQLTDELARLRQARGSARRRLPILRPRSRRL